MDKPYRSGSFFLKWFIKFILTTEHFINIAALMFIATYCYLQIKITLKVGKLDPQFVTLVSTIAGFYFRGKVDQAIKHIRSKQK